MDRYSVEITDEAEAQLEEYLEYLLFELNSEQAYEAVRDDYYDTLERLTKIAGKIPVSDKPNLAIRNLRAIFFSKHDYVILYRLVGNVAEIIKIYHTLEDYENKV